jgi:hypothetical protein
LIISNFKKQKATIFFTIFFSSFLGVYYDDTHENVEDLVSYNVDIMNRVLKPGTFQFEYSINKIEKYNTYRLTKSRKNNVHLKKKSLFLLIDHFIKIRKITIFFLFRIIIVCNELAEGRIAIIAIGENPAFMHIHAIADSLKVPYISIKWDSLEEENAIIAAATQASADGERQINQVNIHPPAYKLMKAVIDLIDYYKWEYVTILYQESTGLDRIEDLIRLPRRSINDNKLRLQVRQLSSDINKWIYLIKDVKLSGSSHIIVDIQTRYLNKFLEQV